ncbi:Phage tail protein [compost metagenome]
MQSGLFDEAFAPTRSINETKVKGRYNPYFQGLEYEPITLKLTFAFEDSWDDKRIREVKRWLIQDYYKPLWFNESPDEIYYCIMVDEARHLHNGLKQGYITITMRCDGPFTYSPINLSKNFKVIDSQVTEIENLGDVICKPEIFIKKVGNGDISIINQTNGDKVFEFKNLLDGETVYVDCENEYIETNLMNTYRYNNFNNQYISMVVGRNTLTLQGSAEIQFRYVFRRYQG